MILPPDSSLPLFSWDVNNFNSGRSFICGQVLRSPQGETRMHDVLIALAFIGMILAPALVAARSGAAAADESE
jgi:hypothetical protein